MLILSVYGKRLWKSTLRCLIVTKVVVDNQIYLSHNTEMKLFKQFVELSIVFNNL